MRTLICGSLAYDNIMVFPGRFRDHILPDQIHILNVAFLVPSMRREYGGTAGNIAYNMKLLGGEAAIMATVGMDATPYLARLDRLGLTREFVREVPDTFTAQCFITTDLDDNQITAFHPGAMNHAHISHVAQAEGISQGIISPDGRDAMIQHAREFAEAGVPFIFDPGQGLPMFDGPELLQFIDQADWVTVNDYEAKLLVERTGFGLEQLAKRVKALIVTLGGHGSEIYTHGQSIFIPAVKASDLKDPTGCGDAYRSGLLYGLAHGFDWETTGRLASTMGAIKIAHFGPQNHEPSRAEIAEAFEAAYSYRPWP